MTPLFDNAALSRLSADMSQTGAGSTLSAAEVQELALAWRPVVQPNPMEEEAFELVDSSGRSNGVTASRWLCHLLGLCHRTVHLILHTPQQLLVLQMRSRRVRNWPGCLDLAVTGHVRAGLNPEQALASEAIEELGLELAPQAGMLVSPGPIFVDRYCRQVTDRLNPPEHICHVTYVYTATLTAHGLASLHFADGEVDALYLCEPVEAGRLIADEPQRVAPGLAQSLLRYVEEVSSARYQVPRTGAQATLDT